MTTCTGDVRGRGFNSYISQEMSVLHYRRKTLTTWDTGYRPAWGRAGSHKPRQDEG